MSYGYYEEKRCIVCGRVFLPKSGNAKTCSTHCARKNSAINKKNNYQYDSELKRGLTLTEQKEKKPRMDQLTIDAVAAKKKGVTYGVYMAIYKDKARKDMKWDMEFSRIKKELNESRRRHNESSGVKG